MNFISLLYESHALLTRASISSLPDGVYYVKSNFNNQVLKLIIQN